MLTAAQQALAAWFAQSRWTVEQERRWCRRQYGAWPICYLSESQAVDARARLQREAR